MSTHKPLNSEEAKAARKDSQRLERRIRQLERLVRTSEAMTRQSHAAMGKSLDDLRELTSDLTAAKDAAEVGLVAKDRFLATMSHEIRTPMNGVIGCIDLLSTCELAQEEQGLVQTMKGSAETLMALLNDILDFAKLQEGPPEIETRRFDLAQLLNSACDPERARCERKGIQLVHALAPALSTQFDGDEHRLRQVLSNLVSNAVKFTDEGSITVSIRRTDDGRALQFEVSDTGIGMKEEVLGSIFAAFTQADATTTRRFGGTGLGLAISSSLVQAMGGEIEVVSKVGVGSSFRFALALCEALPDDQEEPALAPALGVIAAEAVRGLRILLVDDNPINLKVGQKIIQRLGGQVDLATGGAEAVRMALEDDWDAVLMDCSMPDIDGFEATRMIREARGPRGSVCIVALTAQSMEGDRARCLDAGMDDYVRKPIRIMELQEAILRGQQRRRGLAA